MNIPRTNHHFLPRSLDIFILTIVRRQLDSLNNGRMERALSILNEAPDDLTFSLVLLASLFVTFILGAVLTYLGISYLATAGVQ